MRRTGLYVIATLLCVGTAHAETAYINDEFEITLRSGESTKHSIVRMLPTGARLDVLSRNPQTGYAQVRTDDGTSGYVLTRFVSPQPAARDRLARTQARYEKLKQEKDELDTRYAQLRSDKGSLDSEHGELEGRNNELVAELAQIRQTAANVLQIDQQNKDLKKRLDQSEASILELEGRNKTLAARSAQWWFILGAGAVLIGALLGFLLPRVRWRRKSRWGDL